MALKPIWLLKLIHWERSYQFDNAWLKFPAIHYGNNENMAAPTNVKRISAFLLKNQITLVTVNFAGEEFLKQEKTLIIFGANNMPG